MKNISSNTIENLPEILCITSYPARQCGITTYSQDLIMALKNKFEKSFKVSICALKLEEEKQVHSKEVQYILESDNKIAYLEMAQKINKNETIQMILIQHEFELFKHYEDDFIYFLQQLNKPITIVFHTVLPKPNEALKKLVISIDDVVEFIIVMNQTCAKILTTDYGVTTAKISVIAHGTHLVEHLEKDVFKKKYNIAGRKVLATFGLVINRPIPN